MKDQIFSIRVITDTFLPSKDYTSINMKFLRKTANITVASI